MENLDWYVLFDKARLNGWEVGIEKFPILPKEKFYPNPENLFRALEITSPKSVRYLIIGQDPYFTSSDAGPDAIGIAFAVNPNTKNKIPPSLKRIMKNIYPSGKGGTDLTNWATSKGILLLNAALTVPADGKRSSAGKHLKLGIWDDFFRHVILQSIKANPNVHLIAWGVPAKEKLVEILREINTKYVWCYHPVASKAGEDENSFSAFWDTDVGESLKMQATTKVE